MQDVVANLVGLVKSGVWFELVELDVGGPKDSGPALREIFTLRGMGVEQRYVDCPAGARNARADLVAKSINGICGAIDPSIAMAKSKTSICSMCKGNADGILALPISFKLEQLSGLGQRVRDELTKEVGVTRMVVGYGWKLSSDGT